MPILSLLLCLLFASCYSDTDVDCSLYGEGYNFLVVADSLRLQLDEPLLTTEGDSSLCLYSSDQVVVVSRETLSADSTDTVWVRVARDQFSIGWVREADLLKAVVPDSPISIFIYTFSNRHLIYFLSTIGIVSLTLLVRRRMKHRIRMVHFDDIPTPFPTLLCIAMSLAAVLYACLQHFQPEVWQQFYFSPTLNPFGLPLLPCAFLSVLWCMLLLCIATLDDVVRLLVPTQAALYLFSTLALCMGLYTVFSIAPLVWVAIPGCAVYSVWAIVRYIRHARPNSLCGHCGKPIHAPGPCPWCGVKNER